MAACRQGSGYRCAQRQPHVCTAKQHFPFGDCHQHARGLGGCPARTRSTSGQPGEAAARLPLLDSTRNDAKCREAVCGARIKRDGASVGPLCAVSLLLLTHFHGQSICNERLGPEQGKRNSAFNSEEWSPRAGAPRQRRAEPLEAAAQGREVAAAEVSGEVSPSR